LAGRLLMQIGHLAAFQIVDRRLEFGDESLLEVLTHGEFQTSEQLTCRVDQRQTAPRDQAPQVVAAFQKGADAKRHYAENRERNRGKRGSQQQSESALAQQHHGPHAPLQHEVHRHPDAIDVAAHHMGDAGMPELRDVLPAGSGEPAQDAGAQGFDKLDLQMRQHAPKSRPRAR
jgi:hypothetical protein